MPYDASDPSHSLFVLERPGHSLRYMFVNERSGESLSFRALRDGAGATVTQQHGDLFVRLSHAADGGPTLQRQARGESVTVQPLVGRDGIAMLLDGSCWTAASDPGGWLRISENDALRVTLRLSMDAPDGSKRAFNVWVERPDVWLPTAFAVAVEALVAAQLTAPLASAVGSSPPPQPRG